MKPQSSPPQAKLRLAFDADPKPVPSPDYQIQPIIKLLHSDQRPHHRLNDLADRMETRERRFSLPGLIYRSAVMRRIAEEVGRLSQTQATVLITGESGTGKELIAKAIHLASARANKPFIPFNCTALQPTLLEAGLFGHRRGAFTGALTNASGVIRAAEQGTLLLDEIGDLHLDLQPKLLRFLQQGEILVVGEAVPRTVNVRVLAATHRNLEELMQQGKFREDLYYRLQILEIHLPPLRERKEDLPLLIEHFLALYSQQEDKPGLTFSPEALEALQQYNWPGNVRQLSSEILRAVLRAEAGRKIEPQHLSITFRPRLALLGEVGDPLPSNSFTEKSQWQVRFPSHLSLAEIKMQMESALILEALHRHQWNITRTAAALEMTRPTLREKMKKFGLTPM